MNFKFESVKLKKIFKKFTIVFFFFAVVFSPVLANDPQIIDLRCKREQLLSEKTDTDEQKYYAEHCCVEGNTEKYIECLRVIADDQGDKGTLQDKNFNFMGADLVITSETLPLLIRLVITLALSVWAIMYVVIALNGLYEYLTAAVESHEYGKAQKHFETGLIGVLFAGGSILLTGVIFRILGFQGNPYDFKQYFDELFFIKCESIEEQAICEKYNMSCSWSGGVCVKIDPDQQLEDRKNLDVGSCKSYITNNPCEQ